jgi:hypothetical protein
MSPFKVGRPSNFTMELIMTEHPYPRHFWIAQTPGQEPRAFRTREDAEQHTELYGAAAHVSEFREVEETRQAKVVLCQFDLRGWLDDDGNVISEEEAMAQCRTNRAAWVAANSRTAAGVEGAAKR